MTAQQPGPRIVPPEEAARLYAEAAPGDWSAGADGIEGRRFVAGPDVPPYGVQSPHGITVMDEGDAALIAAAPDLARTAAVLGEEVAQLRAELAVERAKVQRVEWLAGPYLGQPDGYRHYAVVLTDDVHFAVLLEDLRAALAGVGAAES